MELRLMGRYGVRRMSFWDKIKDNMEKDEELQKNLEQLSTSRPKLDMESAAERLKGVKESLGSLGEKLKGAIPKVELPRMPNMTKPPQEKEQGAPEEPAAEVKAPLSDLEKELAAQAAVFAAQKEKERLAEIAEKKAARMRAEAKREAAAGHEGAEGVEGAEEEENPYAHAPHSTELVMGPEKSAWEKLKESLRSRRVNSKSYQKALEFKERLEDSDNRVIAGTMDAIGTTTQATSAVMKKVFGETAVAKTLQAVIDIKPDFDPVAFWDETVDKLNYLTDAFHSGDEEMIAQFVPAELLEPMMEKSRLMRQSKIDSTKEYVPYITRYPGNFDIIMATVDEGAPTMLVRFTIQKTVEHIDPATGRLKEGDEHLPVGANFACMLVFSEEVEDWLVHDFSEAHFDLAF